MSNNTAVTLSRLLTISRTGLIGMLLCVSDVVSAQSQPVSLAGEFRASWNSCQEFNSTSSADGPVLQKIVCSLSGASIEHTAWEVRLRIGPTVPDAWRFDGAGCNYGAMTVSKAAYSKACPALGPGPGIDIIGVGYDTEDGSLTVACAAAYDTVRADSTKRYTMMQVILDFTNAEQGSGTEELCYGLDVPVEVFVEHVGLLHPEGYVILPPIETRLLKWLAPSAIVDARSRTWGQIKDAYR